MGSLNSGGGGVEISAATPTTQAHSDSAVVGTDGNAADAAHKHGMPAVGPGAVTREGGNTTEATTTSTSAVDLLTAASLTLAATEPALCIGSVRTTTGAAAGGGLGIKLNATTVHEAVASGGSQLWLGGSANEAENGMFTLWIGARVTNYLNGSLLAAFVAADTGNARNNIGQSPADGAAALPSVEITDVVIRGISGNAAITLGADELQVYSLAAS